MRLILPHTWEMPVTFLNYAWKPTARSAFLATLDDAAFGAASDVTPKFVSPSDPAADGRAPCEGQLLRMGARRRARSLRFAQRIVTGFVQALDFGAVEARRE